MLEQLDHFLNDGDRFTGTLDGEPALAEFAVQSAAVYFNLYIGSARWQGSILSANADRPQIGQPGCPWRDWSSAECWLLHNGIVSSYTVHEDSDSVLFESTHQSMTWQRNADGMMWGWHSKQQGGAPHQVRLVRELAVSPPARLGLRLHPSILEAVRYVLPDRLQAIRRHIADELGIVVPPVRPQEDPRLQPGGWCMLVHGIEVARAEGIPGQLLAIAPEKKLQRLAGVKAIDPTYGMPAVWISMQQRLTAESLGCMIFDLKSVIATQMTEVVRTHAADLLGLVDTQDLLARLSVSHPVLVETVVPNLISLVELRQVLQNLLKERVSIQDLVAKASSTS